MKQILLLLSISLINLTFSQKRCSNVTTQDLSFISSSILMKSEVKSQNLAKFPINKLNNIEYLSILAKVDSKFVVSNLVEKGIKVGSKIGDIITLKVPLDKISLLETMKGITYFEIPSKISPSLDKALKDIRADSVQQGINLPEAYTGKDVLIGITDWGFDYTHPNFYDTLLNQTRILAAWDQYKQSGPAPTGFSYGTEFSTVNDLLAAQSDTANIYSYAYHGSHVAGICGGSGAGTSYRGVAFEAQYLFATFLIDAASVIDAYEWMYQKSLQEGKRLVINQSWGLHHMGNLDGTSLLSQAIDNYSDLGVIFISSAGNNGGVNFHLKKTFNNDSLKSRVDFYSYNSNPNMWGQSLTLWGEPTKQFKTSIEVYNSVNVFQTASNSYSTNETMYIDSMLIVGIDTIFFNVNTETVNPLNNRPHTRFRVKKRNFGMRVVMKVEATDGTVHCWNVTELTTDVGNWGMPFLNNGAGTTAGNTEYGISEPACTNSTIAVAAYATQYPQGTGTTGGSIASFSSFGPTLDERVKPDISAPGVSIGSSFSSFTDAAFTPVQTVTFNGRDYPFAKISGTSMSGPMVTGVVALLLDANPYLSPAQVKFIIKETARQDNFTGVIPAAGSVRWGAGKINAYAAIQLALNTVGFEELAKKEKMLVYPNPADNFIEVNLENYKTTNSIEIFDLTGKSHLFLESTISKIDVSMLNTGTYILRTNNGGKIFQEKFIKN